MKRFLICLTVLTTSFSALAQEVVELEKARNAVRTISEKVGPLPNPPFKAEPDLDSPQIIRKGDIAAVIIPMKGLTGNQIRDIGKSVVPVGMLWLRNLTPAAAGIAPLEAKQMREVVVSEGNKSVRLHPYFMGARKAKGDKLELAFFGKGSEPVISVPIIKTPSRQELPLELAAFGDDAGATLLISVLGKYQAELKIIPSEGNEPEPQPVSQAQKAAQLLRKFVNDFKSAPLKIDPDIAQADLFEMKEVGALIVPHKGLTAKALAGAGKKEMALGQLWMKTIAPSVGDRVATDKEMRLVTASDDSGNSYELPQFLLTARAGKSGLDLIVYSADKMPLLAVPLKEAKMGQTRPIELEGAQRGEGRGVLTIYILGSYRAEIDVRQR